MIGLTLPRTTTFVGKTVRQVGELHQELRFVPIAIQRYGTQYTIIPRGDTQFKEGDRVYFVTTQQGVEEIIKLTGKTHEELNRL